jgi:hypothetical protein
MKHNKKKFFNIMLFTVAIMCGVFVIVTEYTRADYQAPQTKEILVDNLGKKITEIKSEALDALSQCESRGHKEEDGIIIFDSNNEPSIGRYQFQRDTVIHYYKVLYNQTINRKEAVLIALDDDKARKLAYDIIFSSDSKGWRNWFNCGNKIDIAATLKLIAKLES